MGIMFLKISAIFVLALFSNLINAQEIQFEQHVVTNTFTNGYDVISTDIDQDGHPDIIGCNRGGEVAWWQNSGNQAFIKILIKQGLSGARTVRAADINNDSEIDLVCAAWIANDIVYFQNNGDETFTEFVVDNDFAGAHTVDLKDVNGDGYLDILCSGWDYYGSMGEIAWWENDGQNPVSWTKHLISDRFQQSPFIFGEDMDNDNDIDIIACGEANNEVLWWENNGSGEFISENMIDDNLVGAHTVFLRDVDKDGDMDILGAAYYSNSVVWYENDGSQQFAKHSLDPLAGALWLDAVDLDNDGDNDLIAAATLTSNIYWYENDGGQQFAKISAGSSFTQGFCVVPVDMDNDTDVDLLAVGKNSNTISWFENNIYSNVGIENGSDENDIKIFPNPCSDVLKIIDRQQDEIKNMLIFDNIGKLILSYSFNDNINLTSLKSGMYYIKIEYNDGRIYSGKFIKQ